MSAKHIQGSLVHCHTEKKRRFFWPCNDYFNYLYKSYKKIFLIADYLFSQDVSHRAGKEDCSNHLMKIPVVIPM